MKVYIVALMVLSILFTGCSQDINQPTLTPELEKTALPQPTSTPIASLTPDQVPTFTPDSEETDTASPDQGLLKELWEPAINNSIILFSTCEWMFETHFDYQEGAIGLEEAKSKLSIEADFISYTLWDSPAGYQVENIAGMMLDLEFEMQNLVEIIDSTNDNSIGSAETLDSLLLTCSSIQNQLSRIISTARDSGLSDASLNEIDISGTELYADFYEMIFGES